MSLLHYFLFSSPLSQNVTLSIVTDSIELKHKQPQNIIKEPVPTPSLLSSSPKLFYLSIAPTIQNQGKKREACLTTQYNELNELSTKTVSRGMVGNAYKHVQTCLPQRNIPCSQGFKHDLISSFYSQHSHLKDFASFNSLERWHAKCNRPSKK